MTYLTSAQMRAAERAEIDTRGASGLTLMERAGQGVVDRVLDAWPDLRAAPGRAFVLCGPGNNGGDGFVVARVLAERGWQVDLYLYGDPDALPPDAQTSRARWEQIGETRLLHFPGLPEAEAEDLADRIARSDARLVIDALFGTGLTRPAMPGLAALFRRLSGQISGQILGRSPAWTGRAGALRHVAVDIPSGLCADSGRVLRDAGNGSGNGTQNAAPAAFRADLTVTFHAPKLGHVLARGPEHCGRMMLVDIGLDAPMPEDAVIEISAPRGIAKQGGHKYSHGHALVLSGGPGQGGAARMAARGALRIGAGLVTVGCPSAALGENAARLDAVMLRQIADADALGALLRDDRLTALCIGPGLGTEAREEALLHRALRDAASAAEGRRRALVLDADALTLLARKPKLFAALPEDCVLTPHDGEFARLFPDIAERLKAEPAAGPAFSKVCATRQAAERAGCTILFKGPDTVIADPRGHAAISAACGDRAVPWLATAGAGDVLSGFITGLLARGLSPFGAAQAAAWLHVECALAVGPGLIAEDLPDMLPAVLRGQGA